MKTFLRMMFGQFGVLIWQTWQRLEDRKVFDKVVDLAMVYVAKLETNVRMKGPAKMESATASIETELAAAGVSLARDLIQAAAQMALTALRSQAGASAK